jgi:hypothetical protein
VSEVYRFIAAEKAVYPVTLLCRVLGAVPSSYYAWLEAEEARQVRARADDALAHQITVIHLASKGAYGVPRVTLRTVARFCHTSDATITRHHVPHLRGLEEPSLHAQLAAHIVPYARKAWLDLQHPDDGAVRFDHDHYLKIWAPSPSRRSTPTSCSWTKPRTPTLSSNRSSSLNATAPNWSWSATPPRPSTTGAAPKTS